jgi:glycosyltransferase involved in cell wall biosynthesis
VVIGDGPEFERLKAVATPNVKMLGYQSNEVVREHMQKAAAFVFAALEDFGIAPVEAQACGAPVIAYGRGGVLESVVDGRTGILFPHQTADSILAGIQQFERRRAKFNPADIRAHAMRFGAERFKQQFRAHVEKQLNQPVRAELAVG